MLDNASRALLAFTARQMTRSVKGWLFALLLVVPWGVTLLLRLLIARGVPVPLGGGSSARTDPTAIRSATMEIDRRIIVWRR